MLSRNANSIYWLSRYLERADNVARFINVNIQLMLDMEWDRQAAQWQPLILASGDDADFHQRYKKPSEKNVVRFLTFDEQNPNSIISCVKNARENARAVHQVISSEMWEAVNALYHLVEKYRRKRRIYDLQEFFTAVRNASHLFTGLVENTLSQREAWHFARMGRMLERADKTARMLDVKYFLLLPAPDYLGSPYDALEWGAVLKSVNGFKMYCKQYHLANYHDVTNFLIFDLHFPRAIRHCIHVAAHSLTRVSELLNVTVTAQQEMARLQSMLDDTQVDRVLQNGLHEFIDIFQYNLNVVDESLYHCFFALEEN
jgi:uncharacterized alpha-E superfamily protein